ncbi:MAG: calcium/sodium antiporter [Nonlabens sp.]
MVWLYLILGFVLLVLGGEFLVRASVGLSIKLNLSRIVIGLTVVSFATSAPELIVSIQAALNGAASISLGNVVGSNIANIGLVLGLTALLSPLLIDKGFYKFDWLWMLAFTLLLIAILLYDHRIDRWEGLLLLALLVIFVVILIRRSRAKEIDLAVDDSINSPWWRIAIFMLMGAAALWGGSELLVSSAINIATSFNIPEGLIAVTMVAVGTSIPELAASIIAALKDEKAISLGNLIGSNIFNIGSVLGITSLIQPIDIDASDRLLTTDIWWMLTFAIVLLPLGFLPHKYQLDRWKGFLIVIGYVIFITSAVLTLS